MAEEKEATENQNEKKPTTKNDEGSPIVMYAANDS